MFLLSLLQSRIGKIGAVIAGLLVAFLLFKGWLFLHDRETKLQATLEFNKQQLELNIKNQQEFMAKQEEVLNLQRQIFDELAKKNQAVDNVGRTTREIIIKRNSKDADEPVAPILRDTLESLRKGLGE